MGLLSLFVFYMNAEFNWLETQDDYIVLILFIRNMMKINYQIANGLNYKHTQTQNVYFEKMDQILKAVIEITLLIGIIFAI